MDRHYSARTLRSAGKVHEIAQARTATGAHAIVFFNELTNRQATCSQRSSDVRHCAATISSHQGCPPLCQPSTYPRQQTDRANASANNAPGSPWTAVDHADDGAQVNGCPWTGMDGFDLATDQKVTRCQIDCRRNPAVC